MPILFTTAVILAALGLAGVTAALVSWLFYVPDSFDDRH